MRFDTVKSFPFVFGYWIALLLILPRFAPAHAAAYSTSGKKISVHVGILERTFDLSSPKPITRSISIVRKPVLSGPIPEFRLTVSRAEPDRRPDSFKAGIGGEFQSHTTFEKLATPDRLDDERLGQTVRWYDPVALEDAHLDPPVSNYTNTPGGPNILTIQVPLKRNGPLSGLVVELHYLLYGDHPVIRKWLSVRNDSPHWLKLSNLTIDPLDLSKQLPVRTPLTPADYGAQSSVVGFTSKDQTSGLIVASEIPSGLRAVADNGAMGYAPDWFEWIIGPGETFTTEPVFLYAFLGDVNRTTSATSYPLDRTVEGPYMDFLRQNIGIAADSAPLEFPIWISWAQFGPNINDQLIRQQADLAARAGFAMFQIDDGWQRGRLGTEPDTKKFPDIEDTWRYIHARGLKLGLWLSSIRDTQSKDLKAFPDARSVPLIKRNTGYCMAFNSPWREFYINDLVDLHQRWGVDYYKQDFSNMIYGDVGEGHEGRSLKDSILRSLRHLLEAQDEMHRRAPDLICELTHEIYWNTPGPAGDLAVVKHAARYHMSPNHDVGLPPKKSQQKSIETIRKETIDNCFFVRQRFFANRGLPLYPLEVYGANSASHNGSLTPDLQDRQIVSWLMGAPSVFSGDLSTLSDENIAHYRQRFALLKRLQAEYDIYRYFQFSGVPAPTDTDWHWWGKLGPKGGAVIVLRGAHGPFDRKINIPWVDTRVKYRVTAWFSEKPLGIFTGKQLQNGSLKLALPPLGQELTELTPQ